MGVLPPDRRDMRGGAGLKHRARSLRANMTEAERLLWRELRRHTLGVRFRRQFPIPPYVADFACVEARLIIEFDGGQHAQPGADDARDVVLRQQRGRVLRVWNNDGFGNIPGVLQMIAEALRVRHPHPGPPPLAGEGAAAAGER